MFRVDGNSKPIYEIMLSEGKKKRIERSLQSHSITRKTIFKWNTFIAPKIVAIKFLDTTSKTYRTV